MQSSRKRTRSQQSCCSNDIVSVCKTLPSNKKHGNAAVPSAPQSCSLFRQENSDEIQLLTPHIKRLLKLVEEGTSSHAQMAAFLLQETAQRSSPIVLWDLLGRLFSLLIQNTWTCRQNAMWAMERVAQCLPKVNQEEFLQQTSPTDTISSTVHMTQFEYEGNLWLTVQDLDIHLVLERGQILLSEPRQKDSDHHDNTRLLLNAEMDAAHGDDAACEDGLIQRRIQWQRRILAQRLGLEGVVQATGSVTEWLPECITDQDFVALSDPSVNNKPWSNQYDNPLHKTKSENNVTDMSLRALLVLEMKRQHSKMHVSHQNPQSLLATELLYRMVDPHWEVRHGALLGISSLLQAWKGNAHHTAFGAWPQDILARCLCVLALDRFADFATETATAPVRLAAAKVVALLYQLAPVNIQEACSRILITLATYGPSWEVRHGGLLAIQFVVVVVKDLRELTNVAICALEDPCEDVVAAAAQLLLVASEMHRTFPSCLNAVAKAIVDIHSSVSSSTVSLVRLFADELQRHPHLPANHANIWDCMLRFLDYPSSTILISTLQALSSMLTSAAVCESSAPSDQTFLALVFRVFDSFLDECQFIDSHKTMLLLSDSRQGTWSALVVRASLNQALAKDLFSGIMLQLTGLDRSRTSIRSPCNLSQIRVSCRAAAELFAKLDVNATHSLIDASISVLLLSPCVRHCEIAALLYRSLCQENGNLVDSCRSRLQDMLLSTSPPCVSIEQRDYEDDVGAMCIGDLTAVLEGTWGKSEHPKTVIDNFQRRIQTLYPQWTSDSIRASKSIASMRVSAILAGALVSSGPSNLPSSLTPLIRPLMTSLKSDHDEDRLDLTGTDITFLLKLLSTEGKVHIRDKILENICLMTLNDKFPIAMVAAERVVKGMVHDLPMEGTLQDMPPLWNRIRDLLSSNVAIMNVTALAERLKMMTTVGHALVRGSKAATHLINTTIQPLIMISCASIDLTCRNAAATVVKALAKADSNLTLEKSIPLLAGYLHDVNVDSCRLGACKLLHNIIEEVDIEICQFVRYLLPIVMSLMTDSIVECAKEASKMFATLVRFAPLVRDVGSDPRSLDMDPHAKSVMDHLIHGKPLPPCTFPTAIQNEIMETGVTLRGYQIEGVSWLRFLQTVKLHGALCDSMGLGKTLQALLAIVLAHDDATLSGKHPISLVVCPSSVVGHWVSEIQKFFPNLLTVMKLIGNAKERAKTWNVAHQGVNIVVTSYSTLRTDLEKLRTTDWEYCVLDEGHQLKNPKTATALAARVIRSRHRLILTGTPVQNRVCELWAIFDFLMPNFLGSHASFLKIFANPIGKGQRPGASADAIKISLDKLKLLHQQVLPFILRRKKVDVLKELPPKILTDIPCSMTSEQLLLYKTFCKGPNFQHCLSTLHTLESSETAPQKIAPDVLKSLLYLRLLCTHPILVERNDSIGVASSQLQRSGKLQALSDLLRSGGVVHEELAGADNDTSAYYIDSEHAVEEQDDFVSSLQDHNDVPLVSSRSESAVNGTKCLIFAQFIQSIDVVEQYLFRAHMPSLRYLRLDGRVPSDRRQEIVDAFNRDASIQILLLTTRVGGLGLNLTGASMVVLLEHDFNPFADLQAMDRAHRIGQTKTVNVYRLVTIDTIEEKIMALQKSKVDMSNAIVNTENSSLFSMGTDRLLDIFTFRSDRSDDVSRKNCSGLADFDNFDDQDEEYHSLSVEAFLHGFLPHDVG